MKINLFFLAALIFLGGCAKLNQPAVQDKASYNCDEGSFWVAYSDKRTVATINIDIQSIHLKLNPDASLREYTDKTTTFWPEGRNNVYIRQDLANLYRNCLKI